MTGFCNVTSVFWTEARLRLGLNNSTLQIGVGGRGFAIKSTSFGEVCYAIPGFFQPEPGTNLTNDSIGDQD
jgi:hypothetical protein